MDDISRSIGSLESSVKSIESKLASIDSKLDGLTAYKWKAVGASGVVSFLVVTALELWIRY